MKQRPVKYQNKKRVKEDLEKKIERQEFLGTPRTREEYEAAEQIWRDNYRREREEAKREKPRLPIQRTKEEWAAQYKLYEWKYRRNQILRRDHRCCTECGCKYKLQVHHKAYDITLEVWEYPDEYLVTLCDSCHEKAHEDNPNLYVTNGSLPKYEYKLWTS